MPARVGVRGGRGTNSSCEGRAAALKASQVM